MPFPKKGTPEHDAMIVKRTKAIKAVKKAKKKARKAAEKAKQDKANKADRTIDRSNLTSTASTAGELVVGKIDPSSQAGRVNLAAAKILLKQATELLQALR